MDLTNGAGASIRDTLSHIFNQATINTQGTCSESLAWELLGENGFLGATVSHAMGGVGLDLAHLIEFCSVLVDYLQDELAFVLHSLVSSELIEAYGSGKQIESLLPGMLDGTLRSAVCFFDLRTFSESNWSGAYYEKNDGKYDLYFDQTVFIGAQSSNTVIVIAKEKGKQSTFSIFHVPKGTESLGLNLERGQFDDVQISIAGQLSGVIRDLDDSFILGNKDGLGGSQWQNFLGKLHMAIGALSVASMSKVIRATREYTSDREVFGRAVIDFDNTKHVVAAGQYEVLAGFAIFRDFFNGGHREDASSSYVNGLCAKFVRRHTKTCDECLQLFGGYGFLVENPIGKRYMNYLFASSICLDDVEYVAFEKLWNRSNGDDLHHECTALERTA
ncbi:acyl-CoA dehydrogenase family protein [Roseobacter cerasinus]|nr:acyl-CoA dehydrogenase family protein [Roseobacter cerasinus]